MIHSEGLVSQDIYPSYYISYLAYLVHSLSLFLSLSLTLFLSLFLSCSFSFSRALSYSSVINGLVFSSRKAAKNPSVPELSRLLGLAQALAAPDPALERAGGRRPAAEGARRRREGELSC